MGLYEQFPYTNQHELNLDWILNELKELVGQWESFSGNVSATAHASDDPEVSVSGDLKTGLRFDFGLVRGEEGPIGPEGPEGPQGKGLEILGVYATLSDLQQAHPTGTPGDIYLVGANNSYIMYVWNADINNWVSGGVLTSPAPSTTNPLMDGTVSVGTSTNYARADHRHPADTNKQNRLVSGSNIKTINSTSILGSGNIAVQPTLISGSNIKTINGMSLLGSGNYNLYQIYLVEYEATEYSDIVDAYDEGMVIYCRRTVQGIDDIYYLYNYDETSGFTFINVNVPRFNMIYAYEDNTWEYEEFALFNGNYNELYNKPQIHNIPTGGSTGQALVKTSNTNYAVGWTTINAGGMKGVDTSNILAIYEHTENSWGTLTHTATVDCWAVANGNNGHTPITIDGVIVSDNSGDSLFLLPLKAGQTIVSCANGGVPVYRKLIIYGVEE